MRRRGTAQAVAFTCERGTLRPSCRPAQGGAEVVGPGCRGTEEGGRGCVAHRVGELQLTGLRLDHDVEAAALEVRAVGSTGDLGMGVGWAETMGRRRRWGPLSHPVATPGRGLTSPKRPRPGIQASMSNLR